MKNPKAGFASVDEYIGTFPREKQKLLKQMRAAIKAAAPGAQEKISYQMPAFALNGNLVYYAALKNHIGFYPLPSGIEAFKKETTAYVSTKGALQFPIDKPLPLALVRRIVKFRVAENLAKASRKYGSKKK